MKALRCEFDPVQSARNKVEHGIDFHEAQALWDDPDLIEIPAMTGDEPRFLAVGALGGGHWSCVFTPRGGAMRIISVRRSRKEEVACMKAEEFDTRFDQGESLLDHLDLGRARRPGREQKRVNVDFPLWMIRALDREARRLGVPRQAIIKIWLAERLEQSA